MGACPPVTAVFITAPRWCLYRRSQGVLWVHLHPQGEEQHFGVICSTPSAHQTEEESILVIFLRFGGGSGCFSSFRPYKILATLMVFSIGFPYSVPGPRWGLPSPRPLQMVYPLI